MEQVTFADMEYDEGRSGGRGGSCFWSGWRR